MLNPVDAALADGASVAAAPRAPGVAHEHLSAVLLSELEEVRDGSVVTVLDAGCGDGTLLDWLKTAVAARRPGVRLEVFGFDVADHGVQPTGFLDCTRASLARRWPDVDWTTRITAISQEQPWPYADEQFDVVLSNQVFEHVANHDHFVGELARTLKRGGWSAHLFPLKHYVFETHLNLPFAHRVSDHALLAGYIRALSRLGLGKFAAHHRDTGVSLRRFAEQHADYMLHCTNYLTTRQVYRLGKRHHLRTSFRYTRGFYATKLARLLGRAPRTLYRRRSALVDTLAFYVLRYVSCITLFFERRETYRR